MATVVRREGYAARPCAFCRTPFTPRHWSKTQRFCSYSCARSGTRAESGATRRRQAGASRCGHCTRGFERYHGRQIYCSRRCLERATDRRRELRKRVAESEPYTLLEIAERDRWRCWLCGGRVARAIASIDHVQPISLGGADTRANVRLAHHRCNSRRGNRPAAGAS